MLCSRAAIIELLKRYADACFYLNDREKLFHATRDHRRKLHAQLKVTLADAPRFAALHTLADDGFA